jgi:hypothetical protein
MESKSDDLRNRLLVQHVPEPGKLAAYRKEVEVMLERQEKMLRREKWYAGLIWFYVVALATAFLVMSGLFAPDAVRGWFVALATIGVIYVASTVELVKYFISRTKVELLKELKQLELKVLELRERLPNPQGGR